MMQRTVPSCPVSARLTTLVLGIAALLAGCGNDEAIREPDQLTGPVLAIGADPVTGATIETNKDDYLPGEIIHVIGTNWKAGETVRLHMTEEPDTHPDVSQDVVADSAGSFSLHFYDVQQHDLGVTFTLTANGLTSGSIATAVFTDGRVISAVSMNGTVDDGDGTPPTGGTAQVVVGPSTTITVAVTGSTFAPPGTAEWGATSVVFTPVNGGTAVTRCDNGVNIVTATSGHVHSFQVTAPATAAIYHVAFTTHQNDLNATCGGGGGASAVWTWSSGLKVEAPPVPTKLAFTTAAHTTVVGACTGVLTVQSQTDDGTPANVAASTALTLTSESAGGQFYTDNTCTTSGPVSIPAGGHSASFYYQDGNAGTPSVTAAATGLVPAIQEQTINQAATTLTLTDTPTGTSAFGVPVTFQATVQVTAPGTGMPSGSVTFHDGGSCAAPGTSIATEALAGGIASFATSSLTVGAHTIVAVYGGDANYTGSCHVVSHTVNAAASTTSVGSDVNPSVFGQGVVFTATVSALSGGTPTGTVDFYRFGVGQSCAAPGGATPIGSGSLSGGQAQSGAVTTLAVGTHTITACYTGSSSHAASEGTVSQVVNKASTATSLADAPDPSVFGQSVTLTATVSAVAPGNGTPTGTVSFYAGGASCTDLSGATLLGSDNTAPYTLAVTSLGVGVHTLQACYGGDASFIASGDDESHEVRKASTTTTLATSPTPSTFGQSVTLTATLAVVAPGAGTPTGTVTFYNAGSCVTPGDPLGSDDLSSNQASIAVDTLAAGSRTLVACYAGDGSFEGSGDDVPHTVNTARITSTAAVLPTTQQYSDEVDIKTTLDIASPGALAGQTLTGNVVFKIGTRTVGNVAVSTAGLPVDVTVTPSTALTEAAGSYTITAEFSSTNPNFEAGTRTDASLTVTREDATVYDLTHPAAVQVTSPGGVSGIIAFSFKVRETFAELNADQTLVAPGNLNNAPAQLTLTPVGAGGAATATCNSSVSGDEYGQVRTFACQASGLAVETYEVQATVTGTYYSGSTSGVLTVFDPSLGFVTGGGTFEFDGDRFNVGFNAKATVNKKNMVIKGSLLVIRHKANGDVVKVKSNVFDGLAIGNDKSATMSGKANYSVNGVTDPTNYDFTAYVLDGGTPGEGQDQFGLYHGKADAAPGYVIRTSATLLGVKSSAVFLTGGNFQVPQPSGGGKP